MLVAPAVLPKSELDVVGDVLSMTGWPLLGVRCLMDDTWPV